MAASYVSAMTVVPVVMGVLYRRRRGEVVIGEATAGGGLHDEEDWIEEISHEDGDKRRGVFAYFERGFEAVRGGYERVLGWALVNRGKVVTTAILGFAGTLALYPLLANELFPAVDAGQFMIRVRGQSGTRVEKMEQTVNEVEAALREEIPERDRKTIISNIGVLNDWPAAYTPNSGAQDAFINVQLSPERTESAQSYVEKLRAG